MDNKPSIEVERLIGLRIMELENLLVSGSYSPCVEHIIKNTLGLNRQILAYIEAPTIARKSFSEFMDLQRSN